MPTVAQIAAKRLKDLVEQGREFLKTNEKLSDEMWQKLDDATDDLVEAMPEPERRW